MKTVLITGANQGIGFETAKQLAELGYYVYIGSRDKSKDFWHSTKKQYLHLYYETTANDKNKNHQRVSRITRTSETRTSVNQRG